VLGFLEQLGRMQQRLGRNAAHIQAGAAMGSTLFNNNLHAKLGSPDRAHIAARACADNNEIVHSKTFLSLQVQHQPFGVFQRVLDPAPRKVTASLPSTMR
jgi:hypothetical protein